MKPASLVLAAALACAACALPALAQEPKPGEVKLTLPNGTTYVGKATNGVPDGAGYFRDQDGMQYEGEVHEGRRTGMAEGLFPNGDNYKGEWKDGKPDGRGSMAWTMGGAFDGEWKAGKPHGKGTITWAGSGRREAVEFVDGRRVGAPEADENDGRAPAANYSLKSDAPTGTNIPFTITRSPLPLNIGYDAFTPEQKRLWNSRYPALAEGDEPPYPLTGVKQLFELLSKIAGKFNLDDKLELYVMVGADGQAQSVKTVGVRDPEARRLAALSAGVLKYKPAKCGGQPCPMMFGMKFELSVAD